MKAVDENPELRDFFNVISVTADRDGVFYASTMEAKKVWIVSTLGYYPFQALQAHTMT